MLKLSFLVFYNHFTCQLGLSVQLEQQGGAGEQGNVGSSGPVPADSTRKLGS